ncbi:hypothetical protein HK101_004031 [Irineochytrium annulatum]|nr:hypothetical protein HK101_004031 [Irineochytrium annulatum]
MTMIEQRMKEVGAAEGINFSYDGPIGSSFDSMRLLKLAEAGGESKLGMRGRHMRLKEELGKAYFENEKSLADTEVLVACAVKVGMEEKEVRRFLASDEGVEGVSSALQEAHGEGVTGVPFFVINDRFRVSGAQESESFLQIFQKIAREGKGVAGADGRL